MKIVHQLFYQVKLSCLIFQISSKIENWYWVSGNREEYGNYAVYWTQHVIFAFPVLTIHSEANLKQFKKFQQILTKNSLQIDKHFPFLYFLIPVDEKDEVSIKQAVEMIVEAMNFEHGLEVFKCSQY